jgi:hypothetical protein
MRQDAYSQGPLRRDDDCGRQLPQRQPGHGTIPSTTNSTRCNPRLQTPHQIYTYYWSHGSLRNISHGKISHKGKTTAYNMGDSPKVDCPAAPAPAQERGTTTKQVAVKIPPFANEPSGGPSSPSLTVADNACKSPVPQLAPSQS